MRRFQAGDTVYLTLPGGSEIPYVYCNPGAPLKQGSGWSYGGWFDVREDFDAYQDGCWLPTFTLADMEAFLSGTATCDYGTFRRYSKARREAASKLHSWLRRYEVAGNYVFASRIVGRTITSLCELEEDELGVVQQAAMDEHAERQYGVPMTRNRRGAAHRRFAEVA
ncbi:MAG: hypothetical protein AAGJ10_13835 [Bacteroidota bacterium]